MKALTIALALGAAVLSSATAANAAEKSKIAIAASNDIQATDFSSRHRRAHRRVIVRHGYYRAAPYYRSYGYYGAPAYGYSQPYYGGPAVSFSFGLPIRFFSARTTGVSVSPAVLEERSER